MQAPLKKKLEGFATLPGAKQLPSGLEQEPTNCWSGKARTHTVLCNHMQRQSQTHVAVIDKASRTPMCCWCHRAYPFRLQRVDILKHLTNDEKAHRKMCESEQMNDLYMPRGLHVYPCVGMCQSLVHHWRKSPTPGTACLCSCRAVALVCCFWVDAGNTLHFGVSLAKIAKMQIVALRTF